MSLLTPADFIARFPGDSLPLDDAGNPDQAKIAGALKEAHEVAIGYLPFLVDEDGNDVAPPEKIKRSLVGILADIAYWRLSDRVSSDEDARERHKAAIKLLERISATEQKGREGPGEQKASIVRGASDGGDPRMFVKGVMP